MIEFRRKKSRKLDFKGKKLIFFPLGVFSVKQIKTIDLSDNQIKEIPARISELTELKSLYLNNNCITQLHSGILKMKSLRSLYLYGNPMKRLPDFIKERAEFSVYTDNDVHLYHPEVEIVGDKHQLQEELGEEVDNIRQHETAFADTKSVPNVDDDDITFTRTADRKGKSLNTCVLFVDIRDSVQKNNDHKAETLAKMYSAFVYGMLSIAREYNGHVRNIIGDRVMIVFDEEDCCDNAVWCAGTIIYFCKKKMQGILPNDNFRCGVGVHYGNMKVIEVGIKVDGKENVENKNLVWIGEPANLASRLTDMAGKENVPSVVISKDVYSRIANKTLRDGFMQIDRKRFKDIDFSVYGCNLLIK